MTAVERLNFVIWARDRYPGFTTDHRVWTRANRAWLRFRSKDPTVDKVIKTCYTIG